MIFSNTQYIDKLKLLTIYIRDNKEIRYRQIFPANLFNESTKVYFLEYHVYMKTIISRPTYPYLTLVNIFQDSEEDSQLYTNIRFKRNQLEGNSSWQVISLRLIPIIRTISNACQREKPYSWIGLLERELMKNKTLLLLLLFFALLVTALGFSCASTPSLLQALALGNLDFRANQKRHIE